MLRAFTLALLALAVGGQAQEITTVRLAAKRFTVCTVDPAKQRLELFWRDGHDKPFRSFEALDASLRKRGRQLDFAMNAGMFQEDGTPCGLYVQGAKRLRPLNLRDGKGNFCLKPNGVFAVTKDGARVVESSTYPRIRKSTLLATQSGPMLVIDGDLHPAFRKGSESRLIRNGVGVNERGEVVFAIAEDPVNFHEFATLFRDTLGCRNALYLDGNVSALHSTALRRSDPSLMLGPILAITGPARKQPPKSAPVAQTKPRPAPPSPQTDARGELRLLLAVACCLLAGCLLTAARRRARAAVRRRRGVR